MAIFPHWLVLPHMFFFLTWCGNAEANKCTFPIENILRLLCMPLKLEKVAICICQQIVSRILQNWREQMTAAAKNKIHFFSKICSTWDLFKSKKFQPLLHMCKQWQRTRPQNADKLWLVYTQSWFPFSATRLLRLLFVICCHFIVATISLWCAYI